MRKQLIVFMLVVCVLVSAFVMTACNETPDEHTHAYDQKVVESKYFASAATCTEAAKYYYSCTCGEKGTETFDEGVALGHNFNQKVVESKYLASAANCTDSAKYYYSCTCGEKGTETFDEGVALGHNFNQKVAESKYLASAANCTEPAKYYYSCTCGEKGTETFDEGTENGHTYNTEAWVYDTEQHWHAATCEHSELKQDVANHDLVLASDGLSKSCACGYTEACIVDVDVTLEAEDAVLNANHISIDKRAHGGKYALGFNDCGQGMYYRYYAYADGERTIDVAYATNSDNAYMTMFVNGTSAAKVVFDTKTGWFGDNGGITAIATVTVNVQKGWNDIYLIKNGTKDDGWGGYAQIDYITIKGTGNDYTGQSFDRTVETYKFECEVGQWHWASASTRPSSWGDKFSLGYGLGSMDADGDGVKFTFTAQSTGTYNVRLAYGGANGKLVPVNVWINEMQVEGDVLLTNGTTGWNDVQLDNSGSITIEIVEGYTYTIDIAQNGQWFTPDYLILELVK